MRNADFMNLPNCSYTRFPKCNKTRSSDRSIIIRVRVSVCHTCFVNKISFKNELTYREMYHKYNALNLS